MTGYIRTTGFPLL